MNEARGVALQNFVATCLARAGALVEPRGYGLLEVVLPDALVPGFGQSHLLLAFDGEVASEVPGSMLVTYGSPLLEELVGLSAGFGRYFVLYAVQKELRPPRDLERRLAEGVKYERCRAPRITRHWTEEHVFWSFCFRAVFRSYERTEELLPVVVEGTTGNVVEDFEKRWRNVLVADQPENRLPRAQSLPLARLYEIAGQAACVRARQRAFSILQAGAVQRERDLNRVRHYHEELAARVRRQLSAAQSPERRARLEAQLAATMADAARLADDTLARYRVEAQLELDHIVAYHVSCLHLKLELVHRDRVFGPVLVYDPLQGVVLPPPCECCGEPTRQLTPDANGRLVCPRH